MHCAIPMVAVSCLLVPRYQPKVWEADQDIFFLNF